MAQATVKDSLVRQLSTELKDVVDRWFDIGFHLEVPVSKLKEIERNYSKDMSRCLIELLHFWIDSLNPKNPLNDVIACLRKVDLTSFADELESKYCKLAAATDSKIMNIGHALCEEKARSVIVPKREIVNSLMELENNFTKMILDVERIGKQLEVDVSKVKHMYKIRFSAEEFDNCTSLQDVLERLSAGNYISTFNVKALELMNCHYPSGHEEAMQIVKMYETRKDEFLNSTLVVDFQCVVTQSEFTDPKMAKLVVKIPKYAANRRTLKDIETLAKEAFGANCFKSFVHLQVEPGSLCVIWWYPDYLTSELKETVRVDLLLEEGVEEVVIAGECIPIKKIMKRTGYRDLTVKFEEETFNILEVPRSDSALVKEHEELVLAHADLNSLVTDLNMVGSFTRIAYNGVAGYTDLQIKIRRIAVNVSRLCDSSTNLVWEFKLKSRTILMNLQITYQFLVDGKESMAIVTLQSIASVAHGMAEAAEQLAKAFDEESDRVEDAQDKTLKTKNSEEKRKDDLEKEKRKLEIQRAKAESDSAAVEQDIAFHGQQYDKADARQASYEVHDDSIFETLYNIFTGRKNERIRVARQDKERHLQEIRKLREERKGALNAIAECSKLIENCHKESELTESAINSLHEAMRGLKKLSNIMRRISRFWKKLESECMQLGRQDIRDMIKESMTQSKQERAETYESIGFKTTAILYYARWVALRNICEEAHKRMTVTQNKLYEYLEENLTTEQARRNIRQLAIAFSEDVKKEQEIIAVKESQELDEIQE